MIFASYLQNPRCVKRKGFPCRQANKKDSRDSLAILMLIGNLSVSRYNDTISAYLSTKEPKKREQEKTRGKHTRPDINTKKSPDHQNKQTRQRYNT